MLKKIILLTVLVSLWGQSIADTYNQRLVYSINKQWEYCYYDTDKEIGNIPESNWKKINLPHTWNVNEDSCDTCAYKRGIGWYRKNIIISNELKNKKVFLNFEGANQIAELFVNGKMVGRHIGGYTAFTFEISDYIDYNKKGFENQIVVKVDNRFNKNIPPLSADYTFYGGIYRDVWLIATNDVHFSLDDFGSKSIYISTPKVTDQQGHVKVRGKIQNQSSMSKQLLIKNSIYDADNKLVSENEKQMSISANQSIDFDLDEVVVNKPLLWSPANPNLYNVKTEIYRNGKLIDRLINTFGFRYFSFDSEKGFYLNGKHLKLIGTNRHQDFEGMGNALSNRLHVRDVEMIKAAGFNFLRLAHYPQDPSVLEAADRLGLLIWEEIPVVNYVTESEEFLGNCKYMLKEMIRQHYNHPSIIIWGYMNEVFLHDSNGDREKEMVFTPEYLEWTKYLSEELNSLVHKEDSSRLSAIATHQHDMYDQHGIAQIPDVVGYNLYHGWYSNKFSDFGNFIDQVHVKYPERRIVISEYGAGSDVSIHSSKPERFDFSTEYQQSFHEEFLQQIQERPFVGASAVWCQFDFGSNSRGDSKPKINQKGLQYFNREPKDIYFYYQAILNNDPIIRIASHDWNTRIRSTDKEHDIHPIKIYCNVPELEIWIDGKLDRKIQVDSSNIVQFDFQPVSSNHTIEAKSKVNGRIVSDYLKLNFIASTDALANKNIGSKEFAVNIGASVQYSDKQKCLWAMDQPYKKNTWGYSSDKTEKHKFTKGILGSEDDPIFQFYREGVSSYRFDVENGIYEIEIYFAELEYTEPNKRIMDVTINKSLVWDGLDIVKEYGCQTGISRRFKVLVSNSKGIDIGINAKKGNTILNGIRIKRLGN